MLERALTAARFPFQWCPKRPNPKQVLFLRLNCKEALFGGAAGGGKSFAMLMAALQYVDRPEYQALILRRTFALLGKPGAIMDVAQDWLSGTSAVWNSERKTWTFPSGARLEFGHMEHENDKRNYQGAAYHFVGYDEVTEFTESQYTFLFSRLRRAKESSIPIRMRATANPGGLGHEWVKGRFVPDAFVAMTEEERFSRLWWHQGRCFIPAKIEDNPPLDLVEYEMALAELDPVLRAQLRHGDWSTFAGGRYDAAWFRSYEMVGGTPQDHLGHYRLLAPVVPGIAAAPRVIERGSCWRCLTIDSAVTSEQVAREMRGHPPSWTAIGVWDVSKTSDLICVLMTRLRANYPDVRAKVLAVAREYRPAWIGIEDAPVGKPLIDDLAAAGHAVRRLKPAGKDKLARAAQALNMAEQGKLFLPAHNPQWKADLLLELVKWTGDPKETFDQGDALSYAAQEVTAKLHAQASDFAPWGVAGRGYRA